MELGTYFLGWISGLFVGICFGYFAERMITTYKRNSYFQSFISAVMNPTLIKVVCDYVVNRNRFQTESVINNIMKSNNTTANNTTANNTTANNTTANNTTANNTTANNTTANNTTANN